MEIPPRLFRASRFERVSGEGPLVTAVKLISGVLWASWTEMEEGKCVSEVSR